MQVSNDTLIGAAFQLPDPNGRYPTHIRAALQEVGHLRPVVLLAFPPKAAGTFLRSVIIDSVGGQLVRVSQALGGRDATPYVPTFLHYFIGGVTQNVLVGHAHMLALEANLNFLDTFGIRPIVIKRAIPDMLASYLDMIEVDDEALHEGLNGHIPTNFRSLPQTEKCDFMIDMMGPWYVNYYVGWMRYATANPDGLAVIDYRDIRDNPVRTVHDSLEKIGIATNIERIKAAVEVSWRDRKTLRFNKGQTGRGQRYFTPDQIDRLARLMAHFPELDPYRDELLQRPANGATG